MFVTQKLNVMKKRTGCRLGFSTPKLSQNHFDDDDDDILFTLSNNIKYMQCTLSKA